MAGSLEVPVNCRARTPAYIGGNPSVLLSITALGELQGFLGCIVGVLLFFKFLCDMGFKDMCFVFLPIFGVCFDLEIYFNCVQRMYPWWFLLFCVN